MPNENVRVYFLKGLKGKGGFEGIVITDEKNVLIENDKYILAYSIGQMVKRRNENKSYSSEEDIFGAGEELRFGEKDNEWEEMINQNIVGIVEKCFKVPRKKYDEVSQQYKKELVIFEEQCGVIYQERNKKIKEINDVVENSKNQESNQKIKEIKDIAEISKKKIKPKNIEERLKDLDFF